MYFSEIFLRENVKVIKILNCNFIYILIGHVFYFHITHRELLSIVKSLMKLA